MTDIDKWIMERRPIFCKKCGGKLYYQSGGTYECELCGSEELDDFGMLKAYIQKHGATPAVVLEEKTGVPLTIINIFLKNGRLEIPEGSNFYIKCERCGCALRFGRFCSDCTRELTGQLHGAYYEQMGEKPKVTKEKGKMHFLKNERKGR